MAIKRPLVRHSCLIYTAAVDTPDDEFITSADARRILRVSRQRVQQLLTDGVLAGRQDPVTGRWMVCRDSVRAYAKQRRLESQGPTLDSLLLEVQELSRRVGAVEGQVTESNALRRELEQIHSELRSIRRLIENQK